MSEAYYKVVKFHVPGDFDVPSFYGTATAHYRALALRLGADAVSYLQKKAVDVVRQETHADAIKQATEEFEAQLEESVVAAAAEAAKLRTQTQRAEEGFRAAQMRVEALEAQISSARSQALKEVREGLAQVIASKDEQIQRLQGTLERQVEGLGAKLEGLQSSMTKTFSSSKEKGSYGEALMEGLLKRAFDCDTYQVTKDRENADIRMTRKGVAGQETSYFWEIKNYTRMVSTEEIIKFKRDLALHPDVRGGVLVSLRQGIVGKTRGGDIDMELLEDGRFVLYLSNFLAREDPVFYLQSLRPFFDVMEVIVKPVLGGGGEGGPGEEGAAAAAAVAVLQSKAALVMNLLRSHSSGVTKHKNALVGHRKRMDTMFTEFQGYILEAESQLATVLRVAMGGEDVTAATYAEAQATLSPFVFQKESVGDFAEDRVREFVKWLMMHVEAREGGQLELKELIERARVEGYGEKYVRGLREEVFQETAWAKGARVISGLRWLEVGTKIDAIGGEGGQVQSH